jgi:hypothetical protein
VQSIRKCTMYMSYDTFVPPCAVAAHHALAMYVTRFCPLPAALHCKPLQLLPVACRVWHARQGDQHLPSVSPLLGAPVPSLDALRELLPSRPDLPVAPSVPVDRPLDLVPVRPIVPPLLLPVLLLVLVVAPAASWAPRRMAEAGSQSGCDQASFSSSLR